MLALVCQIVFQILKGDSNIGERKSEVFSEEETITRSARQIGGKGKRRTQ